ncbi:MAG: CrcB family protein [Gammaproteobacteria bacterium]|nr:CrcB family protein [Gammaproteobacteria bacterium]
MPAVLAVALGGALGSVLRFSTVLWARRFGHEFPWGTLLVNAAGSFLIGVIWAYFLDRPDTPEWLRLGLMTGIMGGFTTLSSISLETVLLAESGAWSAAAVNAAANLGLGLAACAAGLALARPIFAP